MWFSKRLLPQCECKFLSYWNRLDRKTIPTKFMGFAWCVWAKRAFVWIKMSKTDENQNSTLLILLMFMFIPHISYAYTSVRNREYYLLLYCYTYKVHRIWLCESSLREIKAFGVVWFRTVMVTVSCTDAAHTHTHFTLRIIYCIMLVVLLMRRTKKGCLLLLLLD